VTARRAAIARVALTVILVGGGVGAVSTLHAMDWRAFGAALASVSPLPLALALVVSTVQVYAQLARFVVLVPPEARHPIAELLDATAVGQLLNYATPLRAGDAYKLIRLAPDAPSEPPIATGERREGRFSILLAALLVERVADITALFVMAAWASFSELVTWLATLLPSTANVLEIALGVVVAVVAGVLVAPRTPKAFTRFVRHVRGALWSPRFPRSFGVSLATWALDAGTLYWTTRSIGAYHLSFREVMQSVFVLNLGIAVPVTVGNLGVFEAALAFGLTRHGVPPEDALAIATLEHFVKFAGLGLCLGTLRLGRALRLEVLALHRKRAPERPEDDVP
jgi:uncharacterized membrane protein YbhN (UPF0104 family)